MVSSRLKEFVDSHLAKGFTADNIRAHLMKYGWPEAIVDEALGTKARVIHPDVAPDTVKIARIDKIPGNPKRPKSSKRKISIILAVIGVIVSSMILSSILFLPKNFLSRNIPMISIGREGYLAPDISLGVCDNDTSGCYNSVALYDDDLSLCDKVSDDVQRSVCVATVKIGKLEYREYLKGNSGSFDSNPFTEQCNNTCISKDMKFKKNNRVSVDDPMLPVSIDTQFIFKDDVSFAIMSCYCY